MTLEEMIAWLEKHENTRYQSIIDALKAGQAMRDTFTPIDDESE